MGRCWRRLSPPPPKKGLLKGEEMRQPFHTSYMYSWRRGKANGAVDDGGDIRHPIWLEDVAMDAESLPEPK